MRGYTPRGTRIPQPSCARWGAHRVWPHDLRAAQAVACAAIASGGDDEASTGAHSSPGAGLLCHFCKRDVLMLGSGKCRTDGARDQYLSERRRETRRFVADFSWASGKHARHCPPTCFECAKRMRDEAAMAGQTLAPKRQSNKQMAALAGAPNTSGAAMQLEGAAEIEINAAEWCGGAEAKAVEKEEETEQHSALVGMVMRHGQPPARVAEGQACSPPPGARRPSKQSPGTQLLPPSQTASPRAGLVTEASSAAVETATAGDYARFGDGTIKTVKATAAMPSLPPGLVTDPSVAAATDGDGAGGGSGEGAAEGAGVTTALPPPQPPRAGLVTEASSVAVETATAGDGVRSGDVEGEGLSPGPVSVTESAVAAATDAGGACAGLDGAGGGVGGLGGETASSSLLSEQR